MYVYRRNNIRLKPEHNSPVIMLIPTVI